MNIDLAGTPPLTFYQLATAAVAPRPIAWISSQGKNGVRNLAPFSFFTVASIAPPVLSVTLTWRRPQNGLASEKDTLRNLRETGECVINIVTREQAETMNASCGDYPANVGEIDALNIAVAPSTHVAPPGVAASPVRFECRLRQLIPLGEGPGSAHLALLDVVSVHVDPQLLHNGALDPARLAQIGKLGGDGYATTAGRFELSRPLIQP